MYIARDKDGGLYLYNKKPVRKTTYCSGEDEPEEYWGFPSSQDDIEVMELDSNFYLDITWDDDPVEVTLISTDRLRI